MNLKTHSPAIVERGKALLEPLHSAAIAPVFYKTKLNSPFGPNDLQLTKIIGDINWGEAKELIKHEGFYMFGGRRPDNSASD